MMIHTDGGCLGNPGPGAWAYVAETLGERVHGCGYEGDTTNNRMELQAVIEALKRARALDDLQVEIVTDSRYVEGGIIEWIPRWQANGWKTRSKSAVKNRDLWQEILALKGELEMKGYHLEFRRVRGHAGVELNEECHRLVTDAIAAG